MVHGKSVPGKMVPGKNGSRKNGPRKIGPRKNGPRKNNPRKNGPRETQKRKILGWASSIVVCVLNVGMRSLYGNPKLDNKPKTHNCRTHHSIHSIRCAFSSLSNSLDEHFVYFYFWSSWGVLLQGNFLDSHNYHTHHSVHLIRSVIFLFIFSYFHKGFC